MIYLDSAASYPILPEVQSALMEAFESCYANSASSHILGESALDKVNEVRELLADEIGAFPSEIIFTSGATESNNIAFKSLLLGDETLKDKKHIVISSIEHKCVFAICDYFQKLGYEISLVHPNEDGLISSQAVEEKLREDTALVSIMHVNNELGTINPVSDIGQLCFSKGILFHSDAAQSFCKTEIDVDDMNVDVMSFSAHKIGGPKGIGAIYIRDLRKRNLLPVIHGAGQEDGLRGGTVAAPLVIGFGKAIEIFSRVFSSLENRNIKAYFLEKLSEKDIKHSVNGLGNTLPNVLSLSLPSTNAGLLVRDNESSICLAQGSACSSKEIQASHVLTALGLTREQAEHTFRISFTHTVTEQDINYLVTKICEAKY